MGGVAIGIDGRNGSLWKSYKDSRVYFPLSYFISELRRFLIHLLFLSTKYHYQE